MSKNLVIIALLLVSSLPLLSKDYVVKSPDNKLSLTVIVNDDVKWSVSYNGIEVITPSALSLTFESGIMPARGAGVKSARISEVSETLTPVIPHKNSTVANNYRELVMKFSDGLSIAFRAYNDGVAYRFITNKKDKVRVTDESFSLSLPGGSSAWYPVETGFMSHNERTFYPSSMDTISSEHLASLPALFISNGINVLLTEANIQDYPGMWIRGDSHGGVKGVFPAYPDEEKLSGDRNVFVQTRKDYIAETSGTREYPWRVCIISDDDAGLVASDMVYCLGAPSRIADPGWIKPGKVAWDWYNANNLYGVDFRAGLNNETYRYYIDFASDNGIEYVILDEGWYNLGDVLDVADNFDIKELCDYAASKNVGIILWVVWKTFYDKIDEALEQYEQWGVKGIKVDFMQRDDQWMVNYYHEVAEKAASHHMLVDFHGSYKPDGIERTWPNVITREGVKGLENNKWSYDVTPDHNLILPFTRMVAGPMDYTPGAMVNMQKRDFAPVFYRPASQGTRVHQMAMYVVYESPLMMMADSPSNYKRNQECTTFIAGIPVLWDETRVLEAKAGDYIIIARRKGDVWCLASMTDWTPRNMEADLSFLPEGSYTAEIFCDGINADKYGEDYSRKVINVTSGGKIDINMAPGGGWVARITRQ